MEKIAVINFGSTLFEKICASLDKLNVTYLSFDEKVDINDLKNCTHIILSGSPDTVFDGGRTIDTKVKDLGLPILGICYGHQWLHHYSGGKVVRATTPEEGQREITIIKDSPLFDGLPKVQKVMMHHNDEVIQMAEGYELLAYTNDCNCAASQNLEKRFYTLQFHPEDDGNDYGIEIIKNFIEKC